MFNLIYSVILLLLIVKSKTNSLNKSYENVFNSACGEIFTQKQFILESKNYPSNYPIDYDCSYLIKGPTCPTYYNFQFLDFNLDNSLGCTKDRLEIDQLDALCGNRNGIKSYFASTGTLLVRFVSDDNETGRGYRILVTRYPCGMKNLNDFDETTTKSSIDDSTNFDIEKFIPPQTTTTTTGRNFNPNNFPGSNSPKCCSTVYNTKRFIITSPGFPYSLGNLADCVYEIIKNNENVCRLRMHVLFFYFGQNNYNNCHEGSLKIDGKIICGCKSNLKLISPFNTNSKILTFKSQGLIKNSYTGFVIEITQDECPKRYSPEFRNDFKFYNDQVNRVNWPNHITKNEVIERLKLISENTEILDDDEEEELAKNRTIVNPNPRTVKHTYFFAGRDFDYNFPKDPEETIYIDTSTIDNNLPAINEFYCLNWNRNQFQLVYKQFGQSLENCRVRSVSTTNCIELNDIRGYFKSPGYPYYYPGNLNLCYRLRRLEGYCAVRLYFNDFHLENSLNCQKDYFIFNNNDRRYCGTSLVNTALTFDLRNRNFHDLHFVTDNFYCGRGFTGLYEQIMCHDPTYPVNPINPNPPTTSNPIQPPTTLIPNLPCDRIIQNDVFTLNVYGHNSERCIFSIKKFNYNVCKLRLYFEKFDLICTSESLVVDGTMYCGHLTGKIVTVDVTKQDPVIIYQKMGNVNTLGLRLLIRGVQITDDCLYPEVPAERFLQAKISKFAQTGNSRMDNSSIFVAVDKNLCGIIRNITETDSFCDLLRKNDNKITKCVPIVDNSIYVPYDNRKLEMKINQFEKIEFNEIDCSEMSNL